MTFLNCPLLSYHISVYIYYPHLDDLLHLGMSTCVTMYLRDTHGVLYVFLAAAIHDLHGH